MSERPEPDLDQVRQAMREHDERAAEDTVGDPPVAEEPEEPQEEEPDAPS
jgi:hypothetical protein